jgi:uncharacterized membrane protein YdjX (TVP38/TMEM64 family)
MSLRDDDSGRETGDKGLWHRLLSFLHIDGAQRAAVRGHLSILGRTADEVHSLPSSTATLDKPDKGLVRVSSAGKGIQTTASPTRADKFKFLLFLIVIVALLGITVAMWPYISYLGGDAGREYLTKMVQGAGPWGVLVLLGFQILQVVVAVIPGGVVELVAGMLYGTIGGSAIVTVGSLLSTIIIFYLVRKLGAPFVQAFVSEHERKKMRFLDDPHKLNAAVFILFLIPGMPKDVLTYLVPLTEMRTRDFFILSTLGRVPAIVASCYMGSAFVNGNYVGVIVIGIVISVIAIAGLVYWDALSTFFEKVSSWFKRFE